MKSWYRPLVVAVLALLILPAAALAQRQTETVDRTLPFPNGGTLELKNFSGDVRITAGSGRNFVMKAVRRGRADRLKEIALTVETSGSRIVVEANDRGRDRDRRWNDDDGDSYVIDTDFEIQVPADARLDIDAFSSDVIIAGITGDQRVKTFSGRIEIDAAAQGAPPALDLETFSGDMRIRMGDKARGEIDFNTFSGDLDADFPVTMRSSSRRGIRAELPGGAGKTLTFKSFSGSLRLMR
jgi:hypothetical protein